MEIERKFKIKSMPANLARYDKKEIEQGYLCSDPVVRIRKSNDDYILTYKSKMGIEKKSVQVATVSNETELPLTKESYQHLKEKVDHHIIQKTRYLIPLEDELIAELDVFHDRLDGLIFVEVEFKSEVAAASFRIPEWFGEDVSFDKRYKNKYLATVDHYNDLEFT